MVVDKVERGQLVGQLEECLLVMVVIVIIVIVIILFDLILQGNVLLLFLSTRIIIFDFHCLSMVGCFWLVVRDCIFCLFVRVRLIDSC